MMTSTTMGKSSVIRIREAESLTGGHSNHPDTDDSDDDCSNPFMNDDVCTDSVLRCSSISSLSSHDPSSLHHHVHHVHHHVHCQLLSSTSNPSSAVKKDVNLSSTSCIEVIKRESFNRTSHGHLRNSSSHHHLNSEHHSSSLLNSASTLDAYCESPSFLLDSTTDSSPTHTPSTIDTSHSSHHHHHHHHHHVHGHHSSHSHHSNHHSGHHHHHHHHHLVVGSDDDDADVDESSNDVHESIVSGRVSRMSTETVPDTDLMFSCSGVLDPRDVTVVTPSSIMGDSIVTGDDTVTGVTSESITDHHSHSHNHNVSPVNIISSVNDHSISSAASSDTHVASLIQSVNVVNGTGVHTDALIASNLSQSTGAGLLSPVAVNNVASNGVLTVTRTLNNGIQGHHQLTDAMNVSTDPQSVSNDGEIVSHNSVITAHSIVSNGIVNVTSATATDNVTNGVNVNDRNNNSHNSENHLTSNIVVGNNCVNNNDSHNDTNNHGDDDDPLDTFDIKQEKLDDVDDVTECILRDPPLNHLKTSACRSYIVSSVQRPIVVTTCASSTSSTVLQSQQQQQRQQQVQLHAPSNNIITSSTSNCTRVLPDSSSSTSSAVTSNNPLLANGTVSSTTTSLQHVTSNDALIASTVNRSTAVTLRPTGTLNSTASAPTTAVVLTTSTGTNCNATQLVTQQQQPQQNVSTGNISATQAASNPSPLDIKILPAGLIQLASNLAAVFPASNLHKQQIAIQLLREDGTSIILPITTRGTTVALNTSTHNGNTAIIGGHATHSTGLADNTGTTGANENTVSILTTPTALHGLTLKSNETVLLQTTNGTVSHNHPTSAVANTPVNQTATIITTSPLIAANNVKSSTDPNASGAIASSSTSGTIVNANSSSINNTSSESDRPFKCELCNSTFTRLGNYTRHKKIHSLPTKEDQRFRCDICSKSFIQRCDLARHLHIHRGTEPHRCPQCGKGYIRHSDLVTHQRFHNKEKPFACPHCSKGFCQRGDLNRHLRSIHLQLKPILCTHCHKKFAKEETLLRHINSTHRDKLLDN